MARDPTPLPVWKGDLISLSGANADRRNLHNELTEGRKAASAEKTRKIKAIQTCLVLDFFDNLVFSIGLGTMSHGCAMTWLGVWAALCAWIAEVLVTLLILSATDLFNKRPTYEDLDVFFAWWAIPVIIDWVEVVVFQVGDMSWAGGHCGQPDWFKSLQLVFALVLTSVTAWGYCCQRE